MLHHMTSRLTRVEGSLYLRLQPGYRHVACGVTVRPAAAATYVVNVVSSGSGTDTRVAVVSMGGEIREVRVANKSANLVCFSKAI